MYLILNWKTAYTISIGIFWWGWEYKEGIMADFTTRSVVAFVSN